MFYALNWFFVALLIALWSLTVRAVHAVAVWALSNAGALTGPASTAGGGTVTLPEWLSPWMPPEAAQWLSQLLASLGPVVDGLLQASLALSGGVTIAAWWVWGIGSVLLVGLGAGLHLLIALWRRRSGHRSGSAASATLAAG